MAAAVGAAAAEERPRAVAAGGTEVRVPRNGARHCCRPAPTASTAALAARARALARGAALVARCRACKAGPGPARVASPVTWLALNGPLSPLPAARARPPQHAAVRRWPRGATALPQHDAFEPVEPRLPVNIAATATTARLGHGAAVLDGLALRRMM